MTEVIPPGQSSRESSALFSSGPSKQTSSSRPPLTVDPPSRYPQPSNVHSTYRESMDDVSCSSRSSDTSSPPHNYGDISVRSSLHSTPPSSISLDTRPTDDEIFFPSYNDNSYAKPLNISNPPGSPVVDDYYDASASSVTDSTATNDSSVDSPLFPPVADDTAVREEPSRQVDYLSHDWREEDIWSSWKHIVSRRRVYGERSRLENASWRTWAKSKYNLKTVSPETLNWLKECDVTWLYGPLQEGHFGPAHTSQPAGYRLSKTNSFLTKKPILKKRTISEVMLQKSISTSSLVKQAAAVVQAQRNLSEMRKMERPRLSRAASDFTGSSSSTPTLSNEHTEIPSVFLSSSTSGLESPDGGRKHIRFDDKVEQCIAVDFEPGGAEEDRRARWVRESDDSSDEELVMMNLKSKKHPTAPGNRQNSFGQDGKGIAMLPSTKLKYHHDEPECPGHPEKSVPLPWQSTGKMQTSPSQETLRPSRPSANFLLDDGGDDDDGDISWEPSGAFGNLRRDSVGDALHNNPGEQTNLDDDDDFRTTNGMRRTPSGMFMPFDDEDEQSFGSTGILGRVVDTVNTARDIAHVIWNVGWRK